MDCDTILMGERFDKKQDLELVRYNEEFYKAFSSYLEGDWQKALDLFNFNGLEKKYPKDKVVKILMWRCREFILNPPVFWDGVWVADEK